MNKPQHEFKYLKSVEGFRAVLPGSVLAEAQKEQVKIPLENGGSVSLSDTSWYDQYTISGHEGGVYGDIKNVKFEPNAEYSVFFINKVTMPYMFAVRQPR